MTGTETIDLVMGRLGGRTAPNLRARVLNEMKSAQETDLERGAQLPWFLLSEEELDVLADTRTVAVPAGFLRECDEVKMFILDTDGNRHEMIKKDVQELNDFFGSDATSDLPTHYALVGRSFHLYPLPTTATTIEGTFYMADDAPTDSDEENQWLAEAHDVLAAHAGERVSISLGDTAAASGFSAWKDRATARMWVEDTARMEAARNRVMGDE